MGEEKGTVVDKEQVGVIDGLVRADEAGVEEVKCDFERVSYEYGKVSMGFVYQDCLHQLGEGFQSWLQFFEYTEESEGKVLAEAAALTEEIVQTNLTLQQQKNNALREISRLPDADGGN